MRMRSPFFRCLVILRDHVGQDRLGLLLRQFLVLGDRRRQMLQRDRGRGRCFLRHIWPSSLVEWLGAFGNAGRAGKTRQVET